VKKRVKEYKMENKNKFKYVVWVGGCDDYYASYDRAKEQYNEWIDQGYDDVVLMKLKKEDLLNI